VTYVPERCATVTRPAGSGHRSEQLRSEQTQGHGRSGRAAMVEWRDGRWTFSGVIPQCRVAAGVRCSHRQMLLSLTLALLSTVLVREATRHHVSVRADGENACRDCAIRPFAPVERLLMPDGQ